eukprot:GFUD01026072.1.p1 GENE.GFUD01026072.1~~GFUD01026072.1.p1  ORF type:complete len:814 (+),score=238.89 GFUD01026072.1:113-2554(+)
MMDCATKDGLIIFLLIFSSILTAVVIVLLVIFCRKRCCGGGAKKASPEEGGGVSAAKTTTSHQNNQMNISRVGQAYPDSDSVHEEHYVGEPVRDDLQSGTQIKKADGFFDLRDIPGDLDDEHIYASAMEDNGSFTSYSSIRTFKSRPSLVTVNDEVVDKISVSSKVSKMSSSSSSSSATSKLDISEVHEAVVIEPSEPVYVNVEPTEEIYANVSKVTHVTHIQSSAVEPKFESSSSSESSDNQPIISSPSSSDSDSDDGDIIIAEHTAAGDTIEQAISSIIDKHMPIIEYDLGNDVDWPQKINQLEHEINMSERRFSVSSKSSESSHSTVLPNVRKLSSSSAGVDDYERPASVMDNHQFHDGNENLPKNRFSFDRSSSNSFVEIEKPSSELVTNEDSLVIIESPAFNSTQLDNRHIASTTNLQDPVITQQKYVSHQRSQSSASNSSSDSSSSSNSPSKTIAEVDLSIPLSKQIFTEIEGENENKNFTKYMHGYGNISGDLRGSNGYMYEIQEEADDRDVERKIEVMSASSSSLSSDEEMERKNNNIGNQKHLLNGHTESSLPIRKATPIAYQSSDDNASPMVTRKAIPVIHQSSDDNASPMIIRKATKVIQHSSDDNESPMVIRKAIPVIQHSSDENESPMLIKKATPIIDHSSDESEESYENVKQMVRVEEEDDDDDDAFEDHDLNLTEMIRFENGKEKPKTKPMRGSNSLNVPRNYDRMERISEASENGISRSSSQISSHISSDEDFEHSGRFTNSSRNPVRRNSSGITSSSFISNLSSDYESVYSKAEDAKRRSRASAYKTPVNHEESAA